MLTSPLAPQLPQPTAAPSARPASEVEELPPLFLYLAQVPDHRDPRSVRHPLRAVLALVCGALLGGARHLAAIAEWAALILPH